MKDKEILVIKRIIKAIRGRLPWFLQIIMGLIMLFVLIGCESDPILTRPDYNSNPYYSTKNGTDPKSNSGSLDASSLNTVNIEKKDLIKPGDQVQIMVWGYPEFNTTTTVKDYGTVTIPLIGEVVAAGLSQNQFAKAVKERLSEYVKGDPRVTISHIAMNRRVSVMGAVTKQDNYPIMTDESLIEIIAAAGGPAPGADMQHVKIFRNGERKDVIDVDLTQHLEDGDMVDLPKVRPGDMVFVPKEENLMRQLSDYARDVLVLFGFFSLLH